MSSKQYKLKVKKIPLRSKPVLLSPNFPPFENLHLDLLENKEKLKKNAPTPIFVRETIDYNQPKSDNNIFDDEDQFAFNDLMDKYGDPDNQDDSKQDLDSDNETESEQTIRRLESPQPQQGRQPEYLTPKPIVRTTTIIPDSESSEDSHEKEAKEKADYLFKFMVLRRQYPNVEIQEFTEHSDLNTMKRVYEQIIRRVSLDSNVEYYKQYLIGGFMVMEFVSVNWFGIDIQGFTQQQMKMSNKYDRLLLELGEKNYSPKGSRFPVEIRLVFMIMTNACLFYVQKSLLSGSGMDIFKFLNSASSPAQPLSSGTMPTRSPPVRPTRMRGPSVSPEDIEELARQNASSSDSSV